jgi:hypothetical protein
MAIVAESCEKCRCKVVSVALFNGPRRVCQGGLLDRRRVNWQERGMNAPTISEDSLNRIWHRFDKERTAARAHMSSLPPIREHHIEAYAPGEVAKHVVIMSFLVIVLPMYLTWVELSKHN